MGQEAPHPHSCWSPTESLFRPQPPNDLGQVTSHLGASVPPFVNRDNHTAHLTGRTRLSPMQATVAVITFYHNPQRCTRTQFMCQFIEHVFPDCRPGGASHKLSTHREGKGKSMLTEHLLRASCVLSPGMYFTLALVHTPLSYTFLSLVFLWGLELQSQAILRF